MGVPPEPVRRPTREVQRRPPGSRSMTTHTDPVPVEVFWRPGCPYCRRLRRDMDRLGVPADWRNIREDDLARDVVRRANAGDETVPTVRVGQRMLTNPSAELVASVAGRTTGTDRRRGLLRRWGRG